MSTPATQSLRTSPALPFTDEEMTCSSLAAALHLPRCSRAMLGRVPAAVIAMLPWEVAAEYRVVPIGLDAEGDLRLAMVDPTDDGALTEVEFFTSRRAMREVACATDVTEAMNRYYASA